MSNIERSATQRRDPEELATQPLPAIRLSDDIDAVVAGHICLDIIPTLQGKTITLTPGRLIEAGKAVLATGGAVSNTGLALHRLGVTTRLMGKVGNDLFGQAILQILASYAAELASGMIIAPGEASSYSVILSPPNVDRVIIHAPGCNDTFQADDVRYAMLEKVGLFHFGYPPLMARMYQNNGAELVEVFQRTKECGVTTSLDVSLPDTAGPAGKADWQRILAATLPYVDIFLPSLEELLLMLRRPLFEKLTSKAGSTALLDLVTPDVLSDLGKTLLDMGAKVVALKAGHRGLYLRTGSAQALEQLGRARPSNLTQWADRELWAPCFATQVVGTTGSGDATIAGFLLGLMRGMSPVATLAAACAVGACSVEAADALTGIKSWPETLERLAGGWPRLKPTGKPRSPLDLPAAGWRWHTAHEVWVGPGDPLYAHA